MNENVLKDPTIPVADGVPLLGSAVSMLRNPLQFLRQQQAKQGPVFRVKAGPRELVILSGWDAVKFMNEDGKDCFVSNEFWGKLTRFWQCPHFLSAMDGSEHIEVRRNFKSSMVRGAAIERQEDIIRIVRDTVASYTEQGDTVSARSLTRTLTNSELFLLMTGNWPTVEPSVARSIAEYQRITFNVLVLGKWPRLMLLSPWYLWHKRQSFKFVRELQQQFETSPPTSGFFKAVMDIKGKMPGFTPGDYDFMFLAPFWAGLDTLGAGLTFLLREVVENPQATARLITELDQAVLEHGGIPDAETLRKLPELFGFCMEILRLYPVAFGNGRSASKDFEFSGYKIKKGENLLVFTTSTHFDEAFFPNPECFDPRRYDKEHNQHRQRYAFNPFGRGPHICLGAGMAESMMLTTVATLLSEYNISAAEPGKHYDMIFDPSPTLSDRFKVRIQKRHSNVPTDNSKTSG
ncbi:MAG: hypothetical protein CMN84_11255 [Spongiibacteraceae bacterium]|nr:hypothetical protein [Spongiibacteraceae bacterium]